MNTPSAAPLAAPNLRPTRFDDYPQIQRLESSQALGTLPFDDWRGLFLDNPLWPRLGARWPIGWVLEDATGRIVGSLTNIPSLYQFRGRELVCANSRHWVVDSDYRGLALWLVDEYFNQPGVDLCISTTPNSKAAPVFNTLATRVPVGDWETWACWVTRYRGFARTALEKWGVPFAGALAVPTAAALRCKDALFLKRLPASSVDIEAANGFDARFDPFWQELVRQNPEKLLAMRDGKTLSWHFAIPRRRERLWTFTASRNGLLRAYCVLKRRDQNQGLRRMRLIDYQTLEPDADLLPGLLRASLRRCTEEKIDILDHLGWGLPKMRSFDRFAPYRRKLANWQYFYHTTDPVLGAEVRTPEAWDPSGFDGDASFD